MVSAAGMYTIFIIVVLIFGTLFLAHDRSDLSQIVDNFNCSEFASFFQYLGTPEAQSLRCDLIRFIVGVIHPTNELLCSDIIPRWAVIGWLLTTCTSNIASANAKLALFYDWLFYDPERDNIMNIGKCDSSFSALFGTVDSNVWG